jgi:hypothetical protein
MDSRLDTDSRTDQGGSRMEKPQQQPAPDSSRKFRKKKVGPASVEPDASHFGAQNAPSPSAGADSSEMLLLKRPADATAKEGGSFGGESLKPHPKRKESLPSFKHGFDSATASARDSDAAEDSEAESSASRGRSPPRPTTQGLPQYMPDLATTPKGSGPRGLAKLPALPPVDRPVFDRAPLGKSVVA